MKAPECVMALVTTSSEEEARKIAGILLNRRKAACVNIIKNVTSSYWWKGEIETAAECLMIIKTTAEALPEATELVKINHSYSVSEVIAFPITGGNADYLDWIKRETR